MGSFTEVTLSLDLVDAVPSPVLAAFARLVVLSPHPGAPVLPAPTVETWDLWEPDWREAGHPEGEGDPHEDEPWRHDWATAVSIAAGVATTPHGRLIWSELGRWNLDCRFSWKTLPEAAGEALAWLAPYVEHGWKQRRLVGLAHHELAPRPHLFWVTEGRWEVEDLNPDDEWTWG